jgi:lysophospholipase L1-like esterase
MAAAIRLALPVLATKPYRVLLKDLFTTAAGAPLSTPRSADPGPGQATLAQTDGQFSVVSGELNITAQTTAAWGDLRYNSALLTRVGGLALWVDKLYRSNAAQLTLGFDDNTSGEPLSPGFRLTNWSLAASIGGNAINDLIDTQINVDYDLFVMLTPARAYLFARGYDLARWTLMWTDAQSGASLYAALAPYDAAGKVEAIKVIKARAGWLSNYYPAYYQASTPTLPVTFDAAGDILLKFSWSPVASEVLEIYFRRTDDNNTMICRCDQAGNTIKIIKKESGVETELDSDSFTWGTGSSRKIVLVADATRIRTWVAGGLENNTTSSYNLQAIGVKVTSVTWKADLEVFPRDCSRFIDRLTSKTFSFLVIGDSKSAFTGYPDDLFNLGNAIPEMFWASAYPQLDTAGHTVALRAASIATDVLRNDSPDVALINLGANDVVSLPAEATWKADLSTIVDALHAKWPTMKVYIMRPWRRSYATQCNSLAAWISDVISARSGWCFAGPDERVFLENGDNGVTYTSDGIHPNAAGYALTAAQWKATLGY